MGWDRKESEGINSVTFIFFLSLAITSHVCIYNIYLWYLSTIYLSIDLCKERNSSFTYISTCIYVHGSPLLVLLLKYIQASIFLLVTTDIWGGNGLWAWLLLGVLPLPKCKYSQRLSPQPSALSLYILLPGFNYCLYATVGSGLKAQVLIHRDGIWLGVQNLK